MKLNKLLILIICFVLTSVFVYWQPSSTAAKKEVPLAQAFSHIQGWKSGGFVDLDSRIIEALELDDYFNHFFFNGQDTVSVYIGYYLTSKKVGAAHSPLVCLPGQGWVMADREEKTIKIGKHDLHLMSLLASTGQGKELILYWFQAYDKTSSGTFLQKLYTLWSKIVNKREDNAFVRVSIRIEKQSKKEAFTTGKAFIQDFYPSFLQYIKENKV